MLLPLCMLGGFLLTLSTHLSHYLLLSYLPFLYWPLLLSPGSFYIDQDDASQGAPTSLPALMEGAWWTFFLWLADTMLTIDLIPWWTYFLWLKFFISALVLPPLNFLTRHRWTPFVFPFRFVFKLWRSC